LFFFVFLICLLLIYISLHRQCYNWLSLNSLTCYGKVLCNLSTYVEHKKDKAICCCCCCWQSLTEVDDEIDDGERDAKIMYIFFCSFFIYASTSELKNSQNTFYWHIKTISSRSYENTLWKFNINRFIISIKLDKN